MTGTIDASRDTTGRAIPPGHYGLSDLILSEWTKFRSVRSTMWTLLATVVVGIGIGALATGETRAHWTPTSAIGFDPTGISLTGTFFAQLTIGILGVLVMTSEYGSGTIRATFAASPKRLKVLAAKVLVFGVVVLIVSEIVEFVSFFVGQALLTLPASHATLSTPGAVRSIVGAGVYLCLMGLLALGIATVIRHTAGAISTYIAILLVVPIIIQALPRSITFDVERFLPDHIGGAIISTQFDHALAPWTGILVLAGYAAIVLVLGALLLQRRDT